MAGYNQVQIFFLYFLLIYKGRSAGHTGECRSWKDAQTMQPSPVTSGSNTTLIPTNIYACGYSNNRYILQYQNQNSGEIQTLRNQTYHQVETPPIDLNTAGVYCLYEQCGTEQIEQCCIKLTVMKSELQFPESAQLNTLEYGSCSISTWPRLPINSVKVFTNSDRCKVEILSDRFIDAYTTTVFFVIHVNSFCNRVICQNKEKAINISPFTDPSPSTQDIPVLCTKYMNTTNTANDTMGSTNTTDHTMSKTDDTYATDDTMSRTTNTTDDSIKARCSGALGLYRITLWIIVLTLALLSMIVCI